MLTFEQLLWALDSLENSILLLYQVLQYIGYEKLYIGFEIIFIIHLKLNISIGVS